MHVIHNTFSKTFVFLCKLDLKNKSNMLVLIRRWIMDGPEDPHHPRSLCYSHNPYRETSENMMQAMATIVLILVTSAPRRSPNPTT